MRRSTTNPGTRLLAHNNHSLRTDSVGVTQTPTSQLGRERRESQGERFGTLWKRPEFFPAFPIRVSKFKKGHHFLRERKNVAHKMKGILLFAVTHRTKQSCCAVRGAASMGVPGRALIAFSL